MEKQFTHLDQLVTGKLPSRIVDKINKMSLTVDEAIEWEKGRPSFQVTFTDNVLRIRMDKSYSLKKIFTILGSVIGGIWAIVQFAIPYFS